jgi:hypothetical protein
MRHVARRIPLFCVVEASNALEGEAMFDRSTMPPIRPDLIPATSWGSSLANLLTPASWDALRQPVFAAQGRACQICGRKASAMECHEIWAYSLPPQPDDPESTYWGVQRLIGLAALCNADHEFFHMGFANIRGRGTEGAERLRLINRWTPAEYHQFQQQQRQVWKVRSTRHWVMDVSLVANSKAPLTLTSCWQLNNEGILLGQAKPDSPAVLTILLGASYRTGGRLMLAVDPRQPLRVPSLHKACAYVSGAMPWTLLRLSASPVSSAAT